MIYSKALKRFKETNMKKALPTIIVTLIFLAIIGAYSWGIVQLISTDMTIETMLIPFIILLVFSVVAVLLIVILVKRVKSIKQEETKDYEEY